MLTSFARPKVNLFLHVTGRRADGYHLLNSLVVFPKGGDELSVQEADDITLSVSGPFADVAGPVEDNLVLKAARLLRRHRQGSHGAQISLTKNLPVAAGIGGGSSDAATTLLLLNDLWDLNLPRSDLARLGLELGADIPACVYGTPLIMSGIGEELVEIKEFPKIYILLVNSKIKVITSDIFRRLRISDSASSEADFQFDPTDDLLPQLQKSRNDLQPAALEHAPDIARMITALEAGEGCTLARMSGSGATCFGLFEDADLMEKAASQIVQAHPSWWVEPSVIPAHSA